jgi:hypothetical protein
MLSSFTRSFGTEQEEEETPMGKITTTAVLESFL